MARKLKKGELRFIIGASGLIIGLYMIFVFKNMGGLILFGLGTVILLWKDLEKWINRKF